MNRKIYLFTKFSYAFDKYLPLQIMPGVTLIAPPSPDEIYSHEIYQQNKNDKPYHFVQPALNVSMGLPHIAVAIDDSCENPDFLFWNLILALRLIKDSEIFVSGSFLCKEEDYCKNGALYHIRSQINLSQEQYVSNDFELAQELLGKIQFFISSHQEFTRIAGAINLFGQVSIGRVMSYEMMYLGLWAALESLFGSSANAKKLANLWQNSFNEVIINSEEIAQKIEYLYTHGRNKIAHGNPQFWYAQNFVSSVSDRELSLLYNIVKISLLGFLNIDIDQLKEMNQWSESKVQSKLKHIKANDYFLQKLKIHNIKLINDLV